MGAEASWMSVMEARELAVREHTDQRNRDGSLHVDHVARVADGVPLAAAYQRAAWLHDVLEDSDVRGTD
jgi:(p)ppGpp synthase/HD superfamily hydrolase